MRLLSDPNTFVAALDVDTGVRGVVHTGPGGTLILDTVQKQFKVKEGDKLVTAGTHNARYPDLYPYDIPIGTVSSVNATDTAPLPPGAAAAVREPRLARSGRGARLEEAAPMTFGDGVKAAALLFVAAVAQVSIFSQVHVFGAVPDVLLVTLVGVALLRGSVVGAVGGFFAGLIVDTATLGTLGLTSLVLTLVGYWIGRYGETTGRDRAHAPFLSVAVVTVLYQFGLLVVHFVLGENAPAGAVVRSLVPAIVLNLILTAPHLRARAAAAAARPTGTS